MKKTINIFLIIAICVPIAIMPCTYFTWNFVRNIIIYAIPALAAQILLCRSGEKDVIKWLPAFYTGARAARGIYLYFDPLYNGQVVNFEALIANYLTSFICSIIVLIVFGAIMKRNTNA